MKYVGTLKRLFILGIVCGWFRVSKVIFATVKDVEQYLIFFKIWGVMITGGVLTQSNAALLNLLFSPRNINIISV